VRIGLVCPYSLDVPGGVQNHVRDLARVLSSRGHAIAVLAPGETDAALPSYVTTVGKAVPVRYNGSVARLAFGPRVAARTHAWLRDSRFDVLHVHEPTTPSVSLIALWAAEAPVVATFHTATTRSRALSSAASLLRPSLEKISARIAVSEAARATLVHHVGGEPLVIPNGIEVASFARAEPRGDWQRPGPVLVFLGRIDEPRKGLLVLLEAFVAIVREYPSARLLVAGRGDGGPELVPAAVRDRVRFLGQVTDADRARLLASADVFVAPQTGGESFGIVLAEAMAAGAPVVASDLAAFRAVLGEGRFGVLFRAGDPAACAEAVSPLLFDDVRREELRRGGQQEVLRYDWSRLAPDIEAVYETVRVAPEGPARDGRARDGPSRDGPVR
jgi:phosphatidyl-myo-inositol alpha-mannosyltransferase